MIGETATRGRWAPWWTYVLPIVGVNQLRQLILPFGTVPEWADVVIAVLVAAACFALVTLVYRAGAGR
ncbi:hypothetical protein SAMN04487905_107179 [Actinopolyspora xinjiangensis]|uniref:Uncharacterized protein n=1 Tax=Actinopolyspora xinjiangensis TaxID=405564 RepID=A0A1H0UWB9_9ACTN|nr:hypothetical protein [Actinopolyspora xinjiangensis]SDP70096.1 hypothetical protein SAMN04487905_107179 [Actinopolyspora xinjiangensis]